MAAISLSPKSKFASEIPAFLDIQEKLTKRVVPAQVKVSCQEKSHWYEYSISLLVKDKTAGNILFSISKHQGPDNSANMNNLDGFYSDAYSFAGTQLLYLAYKCSQIMGNSEVHFSALPAAVSFYEENGAAIDWEAYQEEDEDTVPAATIKRIEKIRDEMRAGTYVGSIALHMKLMGSETMAKKITAIHS